MWRQLCRIYTNHYHLNFGPCGSMFANDIIEENYFCQLHGQVIFVAKKIKKYDARNNF